MARCRRAGSGCGSPRNARCRAHPPARGAEAPRRRRPRAAARGRRAVRGGLPGCRDRGYVCGDTRRERRRWRGRRRRVGRDGGGGAPGSRGALCKRAIGKDDLPRRGVPIRAKSENAPEVGCARDRPGTDARIRACVPLRRVHVGGTVHAGPVHGARRAGTSVADHVADERLWRASRAIRTCVPDRGATVDGARLSPVEEARCAGLGAHSHRLRGLDEAAMSLPPASDPVVHSYDTERHDIRCGRFVG